MASEAENHYKLGLESKAKGHTDAALTLFRRAALSDPAFFPALMEIGFLCREKAKRDKMFLRYSFEAFRSAARLDLTHAEAHNQYIMAGQQMGLLDALQSEYNEWAKKFPENELMKKCAKNILALSMAMMPQQVSVGGMQASGTIRKVVLIGSVLALLTGIGCMIAPSFLLKSGKIKKENAADFVKIGLTIEALGIAGFFLRAKIN